MGSCCSCCTTSHHRQVIDRLYPSSDANTVIDGTERHLVPDRTKDLIEYAIPRVFKLPLIGGYGMGVSVSGRVCVWMVGCSCFPARVQRVGDAHSLPPSQRQARVSVRGYFVCFVHVVH